jgi:hypothetical protein
MRMSRAVALVALVSGCGIWPFGRPQQPADPVALVEALRAGGYVIYLTPTDLDFWQRDDKAVALEDCATQRNLSPSGREEARAIGVGFARLLVPVGEVRASPYCRSADTARLAFDRVLLDADLAPLADTDPTQRAHRIAALRHLLGTVPPPGTNTVLVAQSENLEGVGEAPLDEGEAAIMKPRPEGGYQLIAHVPAEAWTTMQSPAGGSVGR